MKTVGLLALLAVTACATTRFPERSIATVPEANGWSLVTEKGWFQFEAPGSVEEGVASHIVGGRTLELKQIVAKDDVRAVNVEYAELPMGFDVAPERLAREMQSAMFDGDVRLVRTRQTKVAGYAFTEAVFDVPPHTPTNDSPFAIVAHTKIFVSPTRIILAIDTRGKESADDRVLESFETL